jgi:hypothetical protein
MKRSNLLLLYFVSFIIGTAIFVDLFHTVLFSGIDVLFYRGIALLVVACAVVGITLIIVWKRFPGYYTLKDIYIIILTLVSVNLLFFTHVPVTAERSMSVFLLGYMNKNPEKIISKEELTRVFLEQYVTADDNIQKRIHEQLVSGDISFQENGYRLTTRGKLLMKMYNVASQLFGIKQ